MAIAYQTTAQTQFTVATATWAINAPTGVADGDLLITHFATDGQTRTVTAAPLGWMQAPSTPYDDSAGDNRAWVYYKIASGEGASWTWTLSGTAVGNANVLRYSGAEAYGVLNAWGASAPASGTSHVGPTVTPTVNGCLVLTLASSDRVSGAWTLTSDGTTTKRYDNQDSSTFEVTTAFEEVQTTATAVTRTLTSSFTDTMSIVTLAFAPTGNVVGPALRNYESGATALATDTSVVINKPQGTVDGDKLIAFLSVKGGSGITFTHPSGWTQESRIDQSTNGTLVCLSKTASSEPSSWTFQWSPGGNAACDVFAFALTAAGVHKSGTGTTAVAGTSHTIPATSANTTVNGAWLFRVLAAVNSTTVTPDAATGEMSDHRSTAGALNMTQQIAYEIQAAAGATGTRTATTAASSTASAMTVALAPAIVTTPVTVAPAVVGAATVTATVRTTPRIAPSVAGASSVSVTVRTTPRLSPAIVGAATATVALRTTPRLAVTVAGSSSVTVTLRTTPRVAPSIGAISSVSVSVRTAPRIAASIVGAASVSAALRSTPRLTLVSVVGVSTVTAAIALLVPPTPRVITVAGSDDSVITLLGSDDTVIVLTGSDDSTIQIGGNEDVATETKITIDIGADMAVEMTVAGSGSLTGTYRASIANRNNPSVAVLSGTPTITDAPAREVTWAIADTDTLSLVEGTNYEYGIWRADAGSEAPLAYGQAILRRLPGAA